MKCHTPDREDEINWTGLRPAHTRHSFSHFSHRAHFSLLDERGCVTCHRIEYQTPEKPYLGSFAYHREEDASGFISNFKSIEQATCAACHTKSMAGESCLTCHNYHIGIFQTTQLKSGTFEHIQATAEPAPKAQ